MGSAISRSPLCVVLGEFGVCCRRLLVQGHLRRRHRHERRLGMVRVVAQTKFRAVANHELWPRLGGAKGGKSVPLVPNE